MNIKNLLHFKKAPKPVYSSEHGSLRERLTEDVYIGWTIIMAVSFIVTVVLMAYAGWLFYLINSDGIASPQASAAVEVKAGFDQKGLESLIASFGAKVQTTSALLRGYDGPTDPSL